MINERHNAYDELQGIGAYITSPRRPAGVLVREKTAKKKREINQKEQRVSAWLFLQEKESQRMTLSYLPKRKKTRSVTRKKRWKTEVKKEENDWRMSDDQNLNINTR